MTRSEKIDLLENFSTFLAANGYMDEDWRSEPPFAIDEFLRLTPSTVEPTAKGMDELKIYRFQAKHIEDTFRLVQRIFECNKKVSSVDRDVMQSWQMIKNVLSGRIDEHVPRL